MRRASCIQHRLPGNQPLFFPSPDACRLSPFLFPRYLLTNKYFPLIINLLKFGMQRNLIGTNVLSNALNGVLGSLLVAGFNVTDGAGL
jgi:hypothetical protein